MAETNAISTQELIRMLRLYVEHKRITRSNETWKPDHYLDMVEEAVNRLEQQNGTREKV